MKSVRYFTLNFSGFTTAVSEKQGYLRLIAGEHVFYTDKRYFNDPALFDHLTSEDQSAPASWRPPPGQRQLFHALTTLASTMWLARDYLPLW